MKVDNEKDVDFPPHTSRLTPNAPIALVLLNMGGPDSPEAVKPFLYNLFSDRELIRLPLGSVLQRPFARIIAHFRSKKVAENYRAIGGRSPLLHWTTLQAQGISRELGDHFSPHVAMRYWHPTAAETVRQLAADGIERAVVLSMYPHYTPATTGSSIGNFRRAVADIHPALVYSIIDQWYDWPGYLDALAARVMSGLEEFSPDVRRRARILFSAHALPQSFIDRGDPYLEHVMATVRGVMERVGKESWHLGFQSRSGPVRWMEPETTAVIDQLAADGCEALLMVPVSFVSDHIETLHEIDMEYREHALSRGIRFFARSPSLNDHPDFMRGMADLVRNHLERL
jgi:protoporphyrin/coproporphyrin ferrochelatase